jgi:capsular exopolysaccharide synthesis family protein
MAIGSFMYKVSAETKSRSSELIYLYMNDFHQQRATDILDTLVRVYDEFTVDFKKQSYLNSAQFITDRLSIVERELSGVEQEVQDFRAANEAIDLGSQSSAYLQNVQQSDQQLAELNLQLELVQKAQTYLASRNSSADPLPALVNLGDPTIASQMGQLFQAESELRRLMQLSGPENPRVLALQQQIGQLRPAIMEGIDNYKSNLLTSRDFYNRKAAGFNNMLKSIPQKEKGLLDITRQQNIKNAVFSYLLQKREESAIAVAATVSNTQFLRRPDAMGLVKPKPITIYSMFIAGALFLFALFVFIRELLHNKFESRKEVERQVLAPIVGEVLQYDGDTALEGSTSVVVGPGSRTVVAEQFREIRTNLRYIGLEGEKKVLLVTSSVPGEGKTFVAINTAVSFSLSNKKVVLLGFDLRKPKLAKELGIENSPGISNYMVGQVEIPEICRKLDGFSNLTVIPSGTIPPNPSELLLHERMQLLMDYLKKEYDIVVIDSPPIGSVTDAKLLAYHADVTLYIMRQLYTARSFFPMIRDAYREKRLPNMALVLNGIRRRKFMGYSYGSYGGYGGYGSHYGYGYGYTEEPGVKKKKKRTEKK